MASTGRSITKSAALCLSVLALLIIITGCDGISVENASISRVENNLLPPVLIEGEQPYTLEDRMAYHHVPGVSIAVIKDFKVEWVKHYGVRDVASGEPVDDATIFCVGSLSKAAAAAIILHLIDQGEFTLDDNVNDYLKSWKVPENDFTRKSAVTIRRLMNHSSGLMYTPSHAYAPDKMPTLIQYLNAEPPLNIPRTTVDYEPGTAFMYANAGFSTLQILAEDVTGESYPEFAKRVLFDPLGMKYSTFEQPLPVEREGQASAGHNRDGSAQDIKRYAYPSLTAGGLWTTAEEYARLIIEIQRALKGESDLIISQELAREMTSPHDAKEYGLGVFMRYTDEVTYFGHIGDLKGFVAGFIAHPTDGYGAVVTTNSISGIGLVREIMSGIAEVYDWRPLLPEMHSRYELNSETMAAYAGRYRVGFDKVCKITKRDGSLFYSASGSGELKLFPISKDSLVAKERLGQLVFVTEADGRVTKCIPHFADDIGRLPARETEAVRMAEGERTPLEMLLAGEVEKAVAAYREHKASFPDGADVSERRFNVMGYQLLNQGNLDGAMAVFKLNTELYPESGNCHDSYGEALAAAGRKQEALRQYQKAVELDPLNGNAAKWIEKLQSGL